MNPQTEAFVKVVEDTFKTIGDGVDSLVTSITGITSDVASLKKQILDLQNSPGTFTPEDQARVDKIQADAGSLATKLESLKNVAATLDAQTEEAPTPTP